LLWLKRLLFHTCDVASTLYASFPPAKVAFISSSSSLCIAAKIFASIFPLLSEAADMVPVLAAAVVAVSTVAGWCVAEEEEEDEREEDMEMEESAVAV
jgi:hypothetical protein